ncbi:MAG TPA: glycosyltransferase [Thermoleophilia bacterium]|nr:glycosyltransferase [Thermoleophilia bacterium]
MRVLVLSSRPPWPPTRADQMTVERLLRFLAGHGVEADLACFIEDEEEGRALRAELGPVCRAIATVTLPRRCSYVGTARSLPSAVPMQVAYYRSAAMARLIDERVARERYDLAYVHLIRMAEYARRLTLPKVLGLQISQALNLRRMVANVGDPARRLFYRLEAAKVRPYEAAVCRDFDRVFLVGRRDLDEIAKTAPVDNAVVQPHGQDLPGAERVAGARREAGAIVMCGVMATYTNVDAAAWFAREVFPLVEREVPEAAFWIVGRQPQRELRALARPPRVVVTGEVDDVYDWLLRAEVGVVPLRIGAGMQNKLLQAMAAGLPVVATPVANEGIQAEDGAQLWLREEPRAFADAVIALLRDRAARERLGTAARAFVERSWTWEAHFERQLAVFAEVAGRRAGAAGGD